MRLDISDGTGMTGEGEDVGPCSHIPDLSPSARARILLRDGELTLTAASRPAVHSTSSVGCTLAHQLGRPRPIDVVLTLVSIHPRSDRGSDG